MSELSWKKIKENSILCMISASFFFALMGAAIKFSMKEVGVFEAVFCRSFFSVILIGGLIYLQKGSYLGNRPLLLLGRASAGFIALSLNFYAVSRIPLGDAALLNQTSPLFVVFLSSFLLREKVSTPLKILSLISLIGVALIVKPSFSYQNIASFAGLGSGLMAAFAYLAIRQLHHTDSSLTMAFYFTALGTVLSFPLFIFSFKLPSLLTLFTLIGGGIAGTFGQLLMTYAYKNERAAFIAPFSYTSVLFSFLLGSFLFGEWPDIYTLLGGILVILSCLFISKQPKEKK